MDNNAPLALTRPRIKLLIVDDHDIVLYGLKMLFEKKKDFDVCATAQSCQEAFNCVIEHKPNIVLMDMRLPDGDGISMGSKIKEAFPMIKVVLLTAFDNNSIKQEANRANIDGFLLKQINSDQLYQSVLEIALADTESAKTNNIVHTMGKLSFKNHVNLSGKENEIMNLMALGKSNQEIAHLLDCSDKTIRNQITQIYQKINVNSRTEAIILWLRLQMIDS